MFKKIIVRFVCLPLILLTLLFVGCFVCGVVLEYQAELEYRRANKLNDLEYGSEAWILEATRQAEQGHAHAQNDLGRFYLGYYRDVNGNSYGTTNLEEGVKWIRKAAEQGDVTAQIDMSRCYKMGEGVPKDKAEADRWLRKAVAQGNDYAMYSLGMDYYYDSDKAEAVQWLRKGAEKGSANAMHALSHCYYHGEGVPENKAEAEKWLNKAKQAGWEPTRVSVSIVEPPEYQCEEWLSETKQKAEQGDAESQYMLGWYYSYRKYQGDGFMEAYSEKGILYGNRFKEDDFAPPLDMEESLKWYRKAAEQGHEVAAEVLRTIKM